MKKIIYSAMAVAMLATTSCKDDFAESFVGEEATVEFSISTADMNTRAYSDADQIDHLHYAIYEEDGTITQLTAKNVNFDGSAKLQLQLKTGKTYKAIFWADDENAPYDIDFDAKTMTVNYLDENGNVNVNCNDENLDAFYAVEEINVSQSAIKNVVLTRPFAQINVGANDLTQSIKANYRPTQSSMSVPVYTTLNLWNGSVADRYQVEYAYNDLPTEALEVNGQNYTYIAMNYVLVDERETIDVTFKHKDAKGVETSKTVGSVPVQRNYRTNIYGKLLTSTVDVNVEIEPDYEVEDYLIYNVVVDGTSYDDLRVAAAKALELNKPIEFIQNVTINADETITVPADQTLTLNLNGYALYSITEDADKNDDGKITSADNEVLFDVRGVMNVNKGIVSMFAKGEGYDNFGWNACADVFYVGFGGTLNVEGSTIENYGGVSMAYAIDMVNATDGITVNVNNSTLKSSYIPVRVFNNGDGMNNVTIKNSTLEGVSRAFWVHVYTQADAASFFNNGKDINGNGYKDETLNINIYNPTCNNTFKANDPDRIIEYGFTNEINFDEYGNQIGNTAYVSSADELTKALAKGGNIAMTQYITTEAATTAPYGNKYAFKMDGGVLNGNGYELHMECYGDDYGIMTYGGTIKNVIIQEGCRAVMIMYPQSDIILDNVNIGGNGVLYPINTGEAGAAGVKLIVTNSILAGWTSYGLIESASFTNVEFKQGTYYNNIYGRVLKPYVNTTLTNCTFVEHMNLDLSALTTDHKVVMKNCKVNGQVVTASTFTIPTTDAQYDTELFTVDLPSWASSINDCIVFE